ncbi:MAG: hypoxanthine phosphoribosyltransferase [Deltaproteobacteria bacterium]|nr:hypoxanthine phosphoribosyltransferase [Deltaproteobacteria bacterium]
MTVTTNKPNHFWHEHISVLYDAETIAARVEDLSKQITKDYAGYEPVILGILKGSFIFMADIIRSINLNLTCDFIGISSYGDATISSGVVQITRDLSQSIENKHVLIVEDIIDTGLTMQYLLENLKTRRPQSVKICTLLNKPANNRMSMPIDYLGFSVPNAFVVGYGLDYAGRYRNLPFIGVYNVSSND